MDVLSDVLRVVRLSGAVFFTADLSSPWALESPVPEMLASAVMPEAECVVLFHILVEGECEVACKAHPVAAMQTGDVIVFPRGEQHTMRSHAAQRTGGLLEVPEHRVAEHHLAAARLVAGGGARLRPRRRAARAPSTSARSG